MGSNNLSGVEVFQGRGGDDFINGGGGFDRALYWFRTDDNVTGGITVDMAAGTVDGDASVGNDTLRSIEAVRGTNFADSYDATGFTTTSINGPNFGSAGFTVIGGVQEAFNEFEGLGGNDSITGNGNTRISYINATDGVTVDLLAGTAQGIAPGDLANVGNDTFTGVNAIQGSYFADELYGSNNASGTAESFDGGAGDDYIDGRGGFDQAYYNVAVGTTSGITVNMAAGTVVGDVSIGTDTLRSIESVRGTNFADTYNATGFGQAGALNIGSNGTFNEFEGLGGNDTITGNGNTRISYVSATGGVTVDLAAGTATGDASVGTDTFTGVSQVRGSQFADTLFRRLQQQHPRRPERQRRARWPRWQRYAHRGNGRRYVRLCRQWWGGCRYRLQPRPGRQDRPDRGDGDLQPGGRSGDCHTEWRQHGDQLRRRQYADAQQCHARQSNGERLCVRPAYHWRLGAYCCQG